MREACEEYQQRVDLVDAPGTSVVRETVRQRSRVLVCVCGGVAVELGSAKRSNRWGFASSSKSNRVVRVWYPGCETGRVGCRPDSETPAAKMQSYARSRRRRSELKCHLSPVTAQQAEHLACKAASVAFVVMSCPVCTFRVRRILQSVANPQPRGRYAPHAPVTGERFAISKMTGHMEPPVECPVKTSPNNDGTPSSI